MVNPFYDKRRPTTTTTRYKPGAKADVNMKPAFPTEKAGGKTQPRDRSLGMRKAKVHPRSRGL